MSSHPQHLPLFRDYPLLAEELPYVSLGLLPTPVEKLGQLGHGIGLDRLFIKRDDLSGQTYGGNKVRKLEFLLGDVLRRDAREVITFGFAGSNHALATAIYAGKVGLGCTSLLLPQINAHYVRRNLLASYYYHAQLHHHDSLMLLTWGIIGKLVRGKTKHGVFPRFIPAGGSCPLGVVGYVNAAFELRDQIAAGKIPEPDRVYLPMGSMGTSVGLALGIKAAGLRTKVIAVRVVEERVASAKGMARLIRDTGLLLRKLDPAFPAIELSETDLVVRDECLGKGYARFTKAGVRAADLVRDKAGVILNGAYSAKAFAALLDDADKQVLADKVVLFWNTYNSRDLSVAASNVDYHRLPRGFHRYFLEDVQPLDRAGVDR